MRDRLIELLEAEGGFSRYMTDDERRAKLADHLLAAGVIVPPCKVGDVVEHCGILYRCDRAEYYVDEGKEPYWRYWATPIDADVDCLWFFSDAICTDVLVLTREEAERALAERRESDG